MEWRPKQTFSITDGELNFIFCRGWHGKKISYRSLPKKQLSVPWAINCPQISGTCIKQTKNNPSPSPKKLPYIMYLCKAKATMSKFILVPAEVQQHWLWTVIRIYGFKSPFLFLFLHGIKDILLLPLKQL